MATCKQIAETMADRSGDEAWLALGDSEWFEQFDSVDEAVAFIEANSMTPEHVPVRPVREAV